ncbi:MAG: cyclopropane fatty acyl phospholipid synthase [Desulfobacterales bacterium]|jgi:cyclopropane-fatty-acyl-phospholipid synthase
MGHETAIAGDSMQKSSEQQTIQDMFNIADIQINGDRPWDIQVRNPKLYQRILAGGSLALGESYMDGWWDCEALDQFFAKIMQARLDRKVKHSPRALWAIFKAKITNPQRRSKAYEIGRRHYDIGNDLFEVMLDQQMNYSCGYWKNAKNLNEAQEEKLDLICRKLSLKPGMRVLDIGCGWGGFAKFAAENYDVRVLGITVSREQVEYASRCCRQVAVEIKFQDYRTLHDIFDRIISIGMFEHVGSKNYGTYMQVVHRCLAPDGLFLLHTIAGNTSVSSTDPWINKYIFPNSMLPSAKQITSAAEGLFVLEDWHSFGPYYDDTLMAWYGNFKANWDKIRDAYDQRFFRMWAYYLLSCAGSFRARRNQLWQIVFSKKGVSGGYTSIR